MHDEELALVYYNYRYYNPADGRWINRDPIAEEGGWNLYGFVRNVPMICTDYLGKDTLGELIYARYVINFLRGIGTVVPFPSKPAMIPMPMRPIISTWAGTEEEPANWASECMRPMVSVMP